jgi:peroxiredoxin/uncharacterized membrane protein YphA (DoxX/SURF4 family)
MNVVLLAARLLLALVFAGAGLAKLADRAGSRKLATDFGVPPALTLPVAWLLPLGELACAVALIPTASAWWGAVGVFAMLSLFIVAIGVSLARGRRPDCHCFGQLHAAPIGPATLVRNSLLAAIAALIIWQGPDVAGASVLAWRDGLSRPESVLLGLVAGVGALALFALLVIYQMLRQNGRLLLRVEALEAKLGAAPEAPAAGLPVNSAAPDFSLKDLDGKAVTLDTLRRRGQALLLFFTEPGCGACDALLPEVAGWQREHHERLLVVPIGRGDLRVNRTKSAQHKLRNLLLQRDREVAEAFHVDLTPGAVLVTDGRIGSPVAVGADAIRALVASATLPAPAKKGDRLPSLQLTDLEGRMMDLATLQGRRTLLLFWNPTCGFCQQMLADVKKWERSRRRDVPDLLIVSGGSSEANRDQGFESRVLLDPAFGAGTVFGAGGTPSAVLIDEEGKVGSDVAVGAPDVFALFQAASNKKSPVPMAARA